tara:strand:+ start:184 stop:522 length:339 start_codon:yes stop_codon:yes gene_type:complete
MEKGAYIFLTENDEIDLFLFKKCTKEELQNALPMNFQRGEIKDNHDCLTVFFHNGADYLGSGEFENIPNIIKEKRMIDLLNNTYENIVNNGFGNLKRKQFDNFVNFSKNQLG